MKIDLSQDKDKEKPLNILRAINKLKKIYLFKNLSEKNLGINCWRNEKTI